MSLDPTAFETIVPCRYLILTIPNPFPPPFPHLLRTPILRIAVLDSPHSATATSGAQVAAMLVPPNRQHDWIFSTQTGHLQLLLTFPHLSRLILIFNHDDDDEIDTPCFSSPTSSNKPPSLADSASEIAQIEVNLMPLLLALTPKSAFDKNIRFPEIPFLSYEDEVVSSSVLEICEGPCVGEMLVENVELGLGENNGREFRRRLRFKRMPNLIQTQVRIHPVTALDAGDALEAVEFRVDAGVLVQPYLSPMVEALALISACLDERIQMGFRAKALCLGVGGGALVEFLSSELGFEVFGVEEDEVVLSMAKKYFGLRESELIHLCVGDGIEFIEKLAFKEKCHDVQLLSSFHFRYGGCFKIVDGKFDVIMVDLDSSDARLGTSAPPLVFVRKSVLLAAREVLFDHGVVIINVIPFDKSFYEMLISEFQQVFEELYEIDVGNGENLVLVASPLEIRAAHENSLLQKLKACIQTSHLNSLRKISAPTKN